MLGIVLAIVANDKAEDDREIRMRIHSKVGEAE